MIDLDKVKPGDFLSYKGTKCIVKRVSLCRNADMTTEVTGITVRMVDYSEPMICPGGFKNLEYWVEESCPLGCLNTRFVVVENLNPLANKVFTVGKIYDVKDGICPVNPNFQVKYFKTHRFSSFEDLASFLRNKGTTIIEVVE